MHLNSLLPCWLVSKSTLPTDKVVADDAVLNPLGHPFLKKCLEMTNGELDRYLASPANHARLEELVTSIWVAADNVNIRFNAPERARKETMAAGQDKGTTKSSWTGIITLIGRSRVAHLLAGGLGKRPAQVNPAEFVPFVFDIAVMQESAAHSIRRFALEHLPFFSNCQPPSFKRFQTHQFINEMSTKSSCIPLPIEHLNENKNADFVKHWQRLLHYLVQDKYGCGSAVAEKNDGIPPITDLHVNIVSQIVYSLPGIGERYEKARKVPMGLR